MFKYRVEAIFPGDDIPTRVTYDTLEQAQRTLIAVLTLSGGDEASVKITRVRAAQYWGDGQLSDRPLGPPEDYNLEKHVADIRSVPRDNQGQPLYPVRGGR